MSTAPIDMKPYDHVVLQDVSGRVIYRGKVPFRWLCPCCTASADQPEAIVHQAGCLAVTEEQP